MGGFCGVISKEDCVNGRLAYRSADLDSLYGKKLRFAIRLENAKLFSLSFEGRPYLHRTPQHSFHDPRPMREI